MARIPDDLDPDEPDVGPKGGQRKLVSKTQLRKALLESNGNRSRAAQLLGVHLVTVERRMREWPELRSLELLGHKVRCDVAMAGLDALMASKQPGIRLGAIKESLKRYGYARGLEVKSTRQITGPDGGPIQHATITIHLTPETIKALPSHVRAKLLAGDQDALRAVADVAPRPGDDTVLAGGGGDRGGDD